MSMTGICDDITIGILIPTFNRREFLERALVSVIGQSYAMLEIIVIDNGSTNGTSDFMNQVGDPRVTYVVNEENLGLVGSINRGIGLMSAAVEWCTVLCDDDFLDADFVRCLLEATRSSTAGSIVHSHRVFVDGNGNRIRDASQSPVEETAVDYLKMRAGSFRETYLTGVLFNRKAYAQIGGYPVFSTGLASDDAFIFALALQDRLVFEPGAKAFIRIHPGAESTMCFDGLRKLQTIREFASYCKKIAKGRGVLLPEAFGAFEAYLAKYVRALSSYWWLASVHCLLEQPRPDNELLAEHFALVRAESARFSLRIRLGVLCEKMTGLFPERFDMYRTFWAKVKKGVLSVKFPDSKPGA